MEHKGTGLARTAFADWMRQQLDAEEDGLVAVLIVHARMPRRLQPMLHAREREALLLNVDRRIEQCLRDVDRYTRLSDETLCVVLSGLGNEAQAVLAAVRITSSRGHTSQS